MSIVNPFFEHKDFEAFEGAVVRVEVELGEGAEQRCSYITAWTVDKSAVAIADQLSHSLCAGQNVLNVGKPVCLDDFGHQILLCLLNTVPAQHQNPHVIERLGHTCVVHIVGAAHYILILAWVFIAEFSLARATALTHCLRVRTGAENIKSLALSSASHVHGRRRVILLQLLLLSRYRIIGVAHDHFEECFVVLAPTNALLKLRAAPDGTADAS